MTCTAGGELRVAPAGCLVADDWKPGQVFGRDVRANGQDGVLYRSVRYPPGQAAAIFWPNCLTLPVAQNQQFRYRWDGSRKTHYLVHGATAWTPWPTAGFA